MGYSQQSTDVFLRKYFQQDGLSSFYVRQILQDKNGFVYIATQEGLDRFDGKQFFHYRKTNEPDYRLAGIDIRSIVEDKDKNLLWVLPGENGVNAINTITGKVTKFIPIKKDNENEWNLSLFLIEGKLLIGTSVGVKVYDIKQEKFLAKLSLPNQEQATSEGYQVRAINTDFFGNIWVCYSGYGIVIYDRGFNPIGYIANKLFSTNSLINDPIRLNALIFIDGDKALVASNKGLKQVIYNKTYQAKINNSPCLKNDDVNSYAVQNLCKTEDGQIYVAGATHLYRFDKALSNFSIINDQVSDSRNDWLSNVLHIFEDRDHAIWIGCNQGLAFFKAKISPFSVLYKSTVSSDRLEHVTGVFKTSQNLMFISLFNGLAVSKYPYSSFKIMDKAFMFYHVFEDYQRLVHVSRSDRMFIFKNNSLIPVENIYPEFKSFSQTPINSHIEINDSLIILGTENYSGILIWNYKKHQVTRIDEKWGTTKLGSGIVNRVYKDTNGKIWVLSDNVITVLSASLDEAQVLTINDNNANLPAGLFFDICEQGGKYWLASYGTGIIELNKSWSVERIFSIRDGLSNDGVYKIFPYKENIIVTTNFGLSVFDTRQRLFKSYYRSDGLHSNNFEEAVGFVKNDTIYCGGVQGVTVVNPELLYKNAKPPKLFISNISLQTTEGKIDSSNQFFTEYIVPSNTLQTTVHFSGINFSDPDRTVFAYKIKEQSKDWINLSTLNFVTLISQPPGTYHLQVKTANEDGVWSEPKELVLEFLPKWYQTWWFKLLVFLATAGIIYAFYRYRIRQIEKQHAIRKDIATDLHDDLGSTLNSVKVFTNLAISGVKQEESLQQIKDNLNEATMGLRDMIWVLDDSLDTVDELVTRLKQYALPVAAASNIEANIKADSDTNSRQLTKEEKRNLFLVCKEAINNSIKYSGTTQINVTIVPDGKKIKITIADNGKGFNVEEVKKGYGLKNMQYRAGQVKYKTTLISKPGAGAKVVINPA